MLAKFYHIDMPGIIKSKQTILVFEIKILNFKRSRDWSLLQKVREKRAVASYSEMT